MLVPHANPGPICPLHKIDVREVCHKCPWFTLVRGKNPQSEEMIDDWRCAVALLPMLLVENAQMTRQGNATMETFRNGVVAGIIQAVDGAERRITDARDHNPRR